MRSVRRMAARWLTASLMLTAPPVAAHPMGNFSICHYTRLRADKSSIYVRYILDMAEIPTLSEKRALDPDHDGQISDAEQRDYIAAIAPKLRSGLSLTANGSPVPLRRAGGQVRLAPGAGGLDTLKIYLDWEAPFPQKGHRFTVAYRDSNYAARTGWKEVVAVAGEGVRIRDTSVPSEDISRELSLYPSDRIPLQVSQALFTVSPIQADSPGTLPSHRSESLIAAHPSGSTPRDAFTRAIAHRTLTPGLMAAGLLIAFLFGAFHALSPGHGKAMVAAYLVGSRGTTRHAVFLGLVVTVSHTAGVFLLGLVTLFASQYILPERLYPILNIASGLIICAVGAWLLYSRTRNFHIHQDHLHGHFHPHDHLHSHDHPHSHIPEGPVTMGSLLALGVSGGMVPCPSALVVLLSAVALHRIAYGLALISAFSLGLASVLVAIGLTVVSARRWVRRLPASGPLLERLPIASAAIITLIGVGLIIRAIT